MTETPENIPQINELLYTVKLRTGEELICTLVDDVDDGLVIESPISVRAIPVMDEDGMFQNKMSTAMWMPFADSRIFFISSVDILTYEKMHSSAHSLYTKLVNAYEVRESTSNPSSDSFFIGSVETLQ